jgi:site-specific DNA-methyltransferase (adenine-specific)
MKDSIHFSSGSNEWETPQELYDELNNRYGFTLDPCATKKSAKCDKYYTKEDDGLSKDWSGEIVFMNPPYGRAISKWVKKASETESAVVVCLIPSRTDTKYWHNYIFSKAHKIMFIKGRLKFSGHKNSAPFPSAIVVFDKMACGASHIGTYESQM